MANLRNPCAISLNKQPSHRARRNANARRAQRPQSCLLVARGLCWARRFGGKGVFRNGERTSAQQEKARRRIEPNEIWARSSRSRD